MKRAYKKLAVISCIVFAGCSVVNAVRRLECVRTEPVNIDKMRPLQTTRNLLREMHELYFEDVAKPYSDEIEGWAEMANIAAEHADVVHNMPALYTDAIRQEMVAGLIDILKVLVKRESSFPNPARLEAVEGYISQFVAAIAQVSPGDTLSDESRGIINGELEKIDLSILSSSC